MPRQEIRCFHAVFGGGSTRRPWGIVVCCTAGSMTPGRHVPRESLSPGPRHADRESCRASFSGGRGTGTGQLPACEDHKVTGGLGSRVAASHMRPIFYLIPGLGDTRLGVMGQSGCSSKQFSLDVREGASVLEAYRVEKPDVAPMIPWGSDAAQPPITEGRRRARAGNRDSSPPPRSRRDTV